MSNKKNTFYINQLKKARVTLGISKANASIKTHLTVIEKSESNIKVIIFIFIFIFILLNRTKALLDWKVKKDK